MRKNAINYISSFSVIKHNKGGRQGKNVFNCFYVYNIWGWRIIQTISVQIYIPQGSWKQMLGQRVQWMMDRFDIPKCNDLMHCSFQSWCFILPHLDTWQPCTYLLWEIIQVMGISAITATLSTLNSSSFHTLSQGIKWRPLRTRPIHIAVTLYPTLISSLCVMLKHNQTLESDFYILSNALQGKHFLPAPWIHATLYSMDFINGL